MKRLFILLYLVFITAIVSEVNASVDGISQLEAESLGMTPLGEISTPKSKFNLDSINHILNKTPFLIIVNKGIRSDANPMGQTVSVLRDGLFYTQYDVSTGTEEIKTVYDSQGEVVRKYIATTPLGIFRATRAYRRYDSKLFTGANMDYAIFFKGGIALHATPERNHSKLGTRASGGCVRLRREDARTLNEILITLGEPNYNTVDESFSFDGQDLVRIKYINRDQFPMVGRWSGYYSHETMWTYDALIAVVE